MAGRWWEPFVAEDSHLCALCGGLCCKAYSGLYLDPLQFEEAWGPISPGSFREVLSAAKLTLKLCMGVPIPLPVTTEEGCVFLGDSGCTLPRWRRPLECLLLVPNEESVFQGRPCCSISHQVRYVECFERWRVYYQDLYPCF